MKKFKELLIKLEACENAREWAGEMTIEQVVKKCHRGDWLLWLAVKINVNNQSLFLANGHCANTVRHLMEDKRSITAVDAAIAYGEGKISKKELETTYVAANDAYIKAATVFNAAAYAAFTVNAAAYAAAYVAAYAAADAVFTAIDVADVAYVSKKANQFLTADICRQYIGQEIINKVNGLLKE